LCAIARYLPSIRIRAPEKKRYFAVPGQEILRLLGCKNIYIEYLQRLFIKRKGKTNSKHETATCGSKGFLSENSKWSGSPY
jgi:hypothetical protein